MPDATRRSRRLVLLLAAVLAIAPAARADTAAKVRALTGARTRVVWVQDCGDNRDTFARGTTLALMGFDTADGRGERRILPEITNYSKPLLTPRGDRVVFSSTETDKVHVVNWDGTGRRDLVGGMALDVWRDPQTGQEWAYVGVGKRSGRGPDFGELRRYRLDRPGNGERVWAQTRVSRDGFHVSADGTRAGGLWPWSNGGVAQLPDGGWQRLAGGCWSNLAPDNSYLYWIFDGAHRGLKMIPQGGGDWKVDIAAPPGIRGFEVYHPKWSNHARYLTMTGPYLGKGGKPGGNRIREGGEAVEVYLGRFDPTFVHVDWVRVTHNERGDFYPDAWIEGGERATVSDTMARAVRSAALPEEDLGDADAWPGPTKGLQFLWETADATNQILRPDTMGGPTCQVTERGRARYGRFFEMILAGGACLAEDADARRLEACQASDQLAIEALITPDDLKASGPARIVTFSSSASSRNFTLGQQGEKLILRLRTPATGPNGVNPQVDLATLEAGRTHHVVVSYLPGRLFCWVDGMQTVASQAVRGGFANWEPQHLLFGGEWNGGRDWRGRLEGIAIFSRFVGPEEARRRYALATARLAGRERIEPIVVEAACIETTPTPEPAAIAPYRRCLALYTYEVRNVVEGTLEAKRIDVTHWVILGGQVLKPPAKVGDVRRLVLEPFDEHPELESERLVFGDAVDFDTPRFHAIED